MNTQQANELVKTTFQNAFDKGRFQAFLRNLLNKFDEKKAFACNSQYVKEAFRQHVSRYERLGTYTTAGGEKIDLLIVHLNSGAKLERARTALRNFVADYLKNRDNKDAALVAFVSPNENQWRFSFVKMEYAAIKTESGKVGIEKHLTPARRFSYIVGEGESCHTAQARFVTLLQDTTNQPTFAQLENAFSVESVTKEFFEQYKTLFLDLKDALDALAKKNETIRKEFSGKNIDTADFAKKLMGQIVFLYFLQKKGWLGVAKGKEWGDGTQHFLRSLFDKKFGDYKNFFNDILEHLFYDTLATDRGHDAWCPIFKCRIPFLNGGLFEPLGEYNWKNTDIQLPNELFSNTKKIDKTGDVGTGILDVFDRYNFTVNEAEPLEKEVAIDPEMLGKVFEELLEIKERKSKGSFYTPREIVHYMCQESLINYLDATVNCTTNDGKEQANEKIQLPREDIETFIHSGDQISHYESVKTNYAGREMPVSIKNHAKLIDEKLAAITVCDPAIGSGAFPVGMMTEIVRARLALTPYFNDSHERTPYFFKRHAIQNCLYGVDIDLGAVEIAKLRLWLSLVVDEEDVKQIKPLPNLDYKIVIGNSLLGVEKNLFNEQIFKRLEGLKTQYFDQSTAAEKIALRHRIDELILEVTEGKREFDFQIYFSEVFGKDKKGGFDVVIANPPYGVKFSESDKQILKKRYADIVQRIPNSYLYFMGLGYNIAKNDGIVSFIEPNEFLFQIYMTKARQFFLNNSQILYAINTGEDVFKAIVPTCVISLRKRKLDYQIPVADLRGCALHDLPRHLNTYLFKATSQRSVLDMPNSIFTFNIVSGELVNKLATQCVPFENFCDDIANGISTSYDDVYIVSESSVIENGFERVYTKPCIRGGQFDRYFCPKDTGDRILYVTDSFDKKAGKKILEHLAKHKSRLIEKCVEKKQGSREWHILFRGRYEELFRSPKIMIRQTADRIVAAPDFDIGYYCIDSVNVALLKKTNASQIAYLLGLLNSRVVNFYYREISQEGGRVLAQVKPLRIRSIPIPSATAAQQKAVSTIVESILSIKSTDATADTSGLELEIDELVYQLYGLTEDEVKIVEGGNK
ncbi:MAG: Eco57I restriction-modification methylase domain-containing protein [Thermoguttaceae bacterium]